MTSAFWPGWLSGVLLALVPVLYYLAFKRLPASSGRYTLLVNRLRFGKQQVPPSDNLDDLVAALRQASLEKFGRDAPPFAPDPEPVEMGPKRVAVSDLGHVLFLAGLVLGGRASHPLAPMEWRLPAVPFGLSPDSPWFPVLLLGGGLVVGFGTRMAGGCTVGHGLCGISRFQKGSLVTTAAVFATGVAASLTLSAIV